jgi:hypothetical protein
MADLIPFESVRIRIGKIQNAWNVPMVGLIGLEPMTLRLSSACSNQLSYRPNIDMEARGFEPLTSSLQSWRSTN